ncbi:hypothetical protein CBL_07121 [Carabus blaptoides fortunei]
MYMDRDWVCVLGSPHDLVYIRRCFSPETWNAAPQGIDRLEHMQEIFTVSLQRQQYQHEQQNKNNNIQQTIRQLQHALICETLPQGLPPSTTSRPTPTTIQRNSISPVLIQLENGSTSLIGVSGLQDYNKLPKDKISMPQLYPRRFCKRVFSNMLHWVNNHGYVVAMSLQNIPLSRSKRHPNSLPISLRGLGTFFQE